MKPVRVSLRGMPSRSYLIRFCAGPGEAARRLSRIADGARIFLVTDRNVNRLHAGALEAGLRREAARYRKIVVPPGERSKCRRTRDALEDFLLRSGAERDSVVAAFGGGVVGDLAGFAASTLLRGIRLVQIPTTLVAQADSSVGGKVGIDHPLGKNLLGAFHHPAEVLTVPGVLRTLPEKEFLQGLAEVVKYGAVLDRGLFMRLRADAAAIRSRRPATLTAVISRCCALKAGVVRADERDTGRRRLLNFGHTIGHALERASGYRIPHGMAVSIGMAVEAGISVRMGLAPEKERGELLSLLRAYGLPVSVPRGLDMRAVRSAIAFDKKTSRGKVLFTLMEEIGRGVTGVEVPPAVLGKALAR